MSKIGITGLLAPCSQMTYTSFCFVGIITQTPHITSFQTLKYHSTYTAEEDITSFVSSIYFQSA